jgi:hypothetical protein
MKAAIRARLADAVDSLSDLDALVEHTAVRLSVLTLARTLGEVDHIASRLERLRQALDRAPAGPEADGGDEERQATNNARGRASPQKPGETGTCRPATNRHRTGEGEGDSTIRPRDEALDAAALRPSDGADHR